MPCHAIDPLVARRVLRRKSATRLEKTPLPHGQFQFSHFNTSPARSISSHEPPPCQLSETLSAPHDVYSILPPGRRLCMLNRPGEQKDVSARLVQPEDRRFQWTNPAIRFHYPRRNILLFSSCFPHRLSRLYPHLDREDPGSTSTSMGWKT